ncbi:MAG: 50S ribosomal protein L21 [Candidatus Marinimicrobia bacterium]|nr:50S ribosomal protein L21 [Candidatus Neomarinimicrobiota bacterium]
MYAIVNISGKQFKATEGSKVRVPKQIGEEGSALEFDNVLLVNDGTNTHVGDPTVSGASVTATILNHGRDKKILVYKKKRRKGYQRKNGHRQWYTELEFQKIISSNTKKAKTASKNTEPVVEKSAQEEE